MSEAGERVAEQRPVVCFNCGGSAETGGLYSTRRIAWSPRSADGRRTGWLAMFGLKPNPLTGGWVGPYGRDGYRCQQCRVVWFWY